MDIVLSEMSQTGILRIVSHEPKYKIVYVHDIYM